MSYDHEIILYPEEKLKNRIIRLSVTAVITCTINDYFLFQL